MTATVDFRPETRAILAPSTTLWRSPSPALHADLLAIASS
jgi:hypothetical protein